MQHAHDRTEVHKTSFTVNSKKKIHLEDLDKAGKIKIKAQSQKAAFTVGSGNVLLYLITDKWRALVDIRVA
jgi:hypothetical protein